MLFLILFSYITNCTKKLCFTNDDQYESTNCDSSNTITNVDESNDISDIIIEHLMPSDTDIALFSDRKTNIKFQMKIFNYKKIKLELNSAIIDVSKVHCINALFSSGNYQLIGSSLIDDQTSFHINKAKINSEVKEIRIQNLTLQANSIMTAKKITVNSFLYNKYRNTRIDLTNDYLVVNGYQIYFTGENKTFAINMSDFYQYQQYDLTIYNKDTQIDFFDFRNIRNLIFNGDGFKSNNLMKYTRCTSIISNVDSITFAPIDVYNGIDINVSKSLIIKGEIVLSHVEALIIDTVMNQYPKTRISIEIESIDSNRVFIQKSWIDLTIKHIKTNDYTIKPCVGLGGSSSITIIDANVMDIKRDFFEITVDVDIPYPDDDYLSLLLSKNWPALIFKNLNPDLQNDNISFSFTPSYIHGFGSYYFDDYKSNVIIKGKLELTKDSYILSIIPSSFSTIPSFLCYTDNNNLISNGKPFNNLAMLNDLIPADQKVINLVIDKKATDLDISSINAKNITFKIKTTDNGSLKSLKLDATNINNLILDTLIFEPGVFELNVKKITFKNITVPPSSFIFDADTVIYTDIISISNMATKVDCTFPLSKIFLKEFDTGFDFYIYDNYINISFYKSFYILYTEKLPYIEFQFIDEPNYLKKHYVYIYNNAVSLKSISFVPLSPKTNSYLRLYLKDFDIIQNADNINIDLSNFTTISVVDLGGLARRDWLTITGNYFEATGQSIFQYNNFCVCNDEATCNEFCDAEYMTIISYSELPEKVKTASEGSVQIIIVGNNNDVDVPFIKLDYLDTKDVFIVGVGTNPKIRIDSSSQFTDTNKRVTISGVHILSDSSKGNIFISNLDVEKDCTIDESLHEVSLVSNYLNISVLQLSFKTIHVNKYLFLYGDARKTEAKTKVTFSPHAEFNYSLPYTITFNDCLLVIKEIEFNLTQVVPLFTIEDKRFYPFDKEVLFTINAINANLDVIETNISFDFLPDQIRIIGNFVNENPSKFLFFESYSLFSLQAENIPAIFIDTGTKIILEKEKVSIAGRLEISEIFRNTDYLFYSNIEEKTEFYVKEIFFDFYHNVNIFFNTTKTQLIIDRFYYKNRDVIFNLLVDLNNHNLVQFINQFKYDINIKYNVQLLTSGTLYDQQVLDFIKKNHTLLTLNELSSITSSCINNIKFLSNITGFPNDNFKLAVDQNELYLETVQSPEISLRYGNCQSCFEVEITNDDLNNIEKFFLDQNQAVISITFYESNSLDHCLNFDKNDIKIQSLSLKSTEFLSSYIKLGNSVSNLIAQNVNVVIQDSNDFAVQKAKMTNGAKFNDLTYFNHLNSLEIDQESLFVSGLTAFNNKIDILADFLLNVNFTSTGVNLVNSELQVFNIDVSKFPQANLIIDSYESPIINLEKGVSKVNQLNSLVFNSSNFMIGYGWEQISTEVQYAIKNEENKNISVLSDSFPFNSWDLMFGYPINLTSNLSPFTFSDTIIYNHNKSMKINVPNKETITVGGFIMSGNSSILLNSTLVINNLSILNGTSLINNSIINNEITLGKGSILSGNFTINEDLDVLNIEWDLNQAPVINCYVSPEIVPKRINIIYKGLEIAGREKQFDKFLVSGVAVLMTNVSKFDILNNVHFISETVSEFNDGDKLILKCICAYDKKIILISTKLFIEEEEDDIIDATPTETPTKGDEPSIGNSFESTSSIIEFTDKGFIDGENFVQVKDDDGTDNIMFINTNQQSLTLKVENSEKPNKELFVSAQNLNTVITIERPSDETNDYGKSWFGIHANSNNPTISLYDEKVPLNIFNNEKSEININLINNQRSFNKISLQNLIISNGDLKMIVPYNVNEIEFTNVESFLNGNIKSVDINSRSIEILIQTLKLNSGSSIKMSKMHFNETIQLKSNSKIEIEEKVTFNDQSIIDIDETSFIEFGKSEINGICDKIRISQIQPKRMIDVIGNSISSEIICGENFDCSKWKEKFEPNSRFKLTQCIQNQNNEMCLVVSNKESKKKKLSAGVIAAIVISICVVIAAVVVVVVFLVRKKTFCQKSDEQSQDEGSPEANEYY